MLFCRTTDFLVQGFQGVVVLVFWVFFLWKRESLDEFVAACRFFSWGLGGFSGNA
jgi:hypothetical protein